MNVPLNPIDELLPVIAQAVQEWRRDNSATQLKNSVKRLLDDNSKEITLKLLGFNNTWGRWELDHFNGRSGNSAAGDFLRSVQNEAIQEWLSTVCLPKLEVKITQEIKTQAAREYKRLVLQELSSTLRQQAQMDVKKLLQDLAVSDQIGNYIKTMQLLDPSGEKPCK